MKTIKTAEEHIIEHLNKFWKEGFQIGMKQKEEDVLKLIRKQQTYNMMIDGDVLIKRITG